MEKAIKSRIESKGIEIIKLVNNSYKHAGHYGAGNDTHFYIEVRSEIFNNKPILDSYRIINNSLKVEFDSGLHALEIKIIK